MALIRSLNTAVAGLRAQQFRVEVIGNNIANVDTTAFKSGRVDFSTLMSQMLSHGVAPQGSLGGIEVPQVWLVQALRHGHVDPLVLSKGVIKQFGELRHVCSHLLASSQVADVFSLRS